MNLSATATSGDRGFNEAREWRRFLVMLLLVICPSLIMIGALEALAWRIGETRTMEAIAQWQSAKPGRMWRGGDGRSYLAYKVARVRLLKPEVIMLGASRGISFRADTVQPYTFYNAGVTAWTFNHYRRFLELVTSAGYRPKVLFFNFDYWMFSKDFDKYWIERFYEQPPSHWENIKFFLDELQKRPIVIYRRLPATDQLKGLYAVLSGEGFREDGSLPGVPPTPDPKRLDDDPMAVGVPPVELGDEFAEEQIVEFERFVAFAKSKNISLIGIQVPYYAKILTGLNKNPRAGIWREFRSDMRHAYFESKGIVFFDFADMPEYRDKPEYFIDSIHPDSRVFGDIIRRILADARVRAVLPGAQAGPKP